MSDDKMSHDHACSITSEDDQQADRWGFKQFFKFFGEEENVSALAAVFHKLNGNSDRPTMSALPLVAVAQSNSPCDIVGDICQAIYNIYDI